MLTFMWATDTMDGRVMYSDRKRYAQVFSNGTYFSEIYPMVKKSDMRKAIKTFVMELVVPK